MTRRLDARIETRRYTEDTTLPTRAITEAGAGNMNALSSIFDAILGSKAEHGPSLIEQLPQDMLVLILQSIDSLRSLRAAVLASSAMYDAFRTAKIETLACVVAHSRPEKLQPEAVALSVVMHCQSNAKVTEALLIHNLWNPQKEWIYLPKSLSSPEILHFHWFVEYFTEKLFKSSMRRAHEKGWLGSEKLRFRRLSHNEIIRVQRAIYRLEFFNLYLMRFDPEDPRFLVGSPWWRKRVLVWEMEEIACVQNLLYHRLAVLEDIIQTLIHEMSLRGEPQTARTTRSKVRFKLLTRNVKCLILSQDLGTLFRILSAPESQSTRRTIRELMRARLMRSERSLQNLLNRLGPDSPSIIPNLMFEGHGSERPCTSHIEKLRAPQEDVEYPSFGYVRAYRTMTLELVKMGHMNRKTSSLYNEKKHYEDRKWGYCLWDKDRIEYWGDENAQQIRKRSRISVTNRGSPMWTTTQLNTGLTCPTR